MKTSKLLPPVVARRINEIKQISLTLGINLRYVDTKNNPADKATRPGLWKKKLELWFYGPKFSTQEEKYWPKDTLINEESCLVGSALDMVDGPEIILQKFMKAMIKLSHQRNNNSPNNQNIPRGRAFK